MRRQSIRNGLAAVFLLAATAFAHAQQELPPPVNGITFEEWAAGNARLVNDQPLQDILTILEIDEAGWDKASEAFNKALSQGDPASYTFLRYGEVFANPAVGRFAGRDDNPEIEARLATYEDYARVQAHLSIATQAGMDPQAVLAEHGLTVYEYSQEAGNWVRQIAIAAESGRITEWNSIRESFEAEYRARYDLGAK